MSSYTKSTDFASKDALLTGNPLKVVKGTEIDDEFNSIQTAVNSKADINSPDLSGTPTAITATVGTNTTQLATTAFVQASLAAADGTGLEEASGVLSISDTGVTADTYGDASNIPQITVNDQGQITSATDIAITVPTLGHTIINTAPAINSTYDLPTDSFAISGHAVVAMSGNAGGRLDIEIYTGTAGSGTKLDTIKASGANETNGSDGGSGMSASAAWTVLLPPTARSIKFIRGTGGRDPSVTLEAVITFSGYHS